MDPVVLAAALSGVAVMLGVPSPARRLELARRRRRPSGAPPSWLAPVPGAPASPVRAAAAAVAAVAVLAQLPGRAGLVLAPLAAAACYLALGRLSGRSGAREALQVALQMPETLDLVAACLDAGAPLRWAVREVAETGPPATRPTLARVVAQIDVGVPDGEAWRSLTGDKAWASVAADLARCAETGTAAADLLRQRAADARVRRRDELLTRARAVGVRSVLPLMCCFLPAFLLTGVVPVVAGLLGHVLHG